MVKYYTRACNFYYGRQARLLIKKKEAFPLCGSNFTAFDKIELFIRTRYGIKSKIININKINQLKEREQKAIKESLKKITSKRKNFVKNINFSQTNIMGILNLTPDSFSDGGKFNTKSKSFKQIKNKRLHKIKFTWIRRLELPPLKTI